MKTSLEGTCRSWYTLEWLSLAGAQLGTAKGTKYEPAIYTSVMRDISEYISILCFNLIIVGF